MKKNTIDNRHWFQLFEILKKYHVIKIFNAGYLIKHLYIAQVTD